MIPQVAGGDLSVSVCVSETNQASRLRALAIAGAALALGLMLWRGAEVFTAQPQTQPASQQDRQLLNLIEPVTGAGNARISVRYSEAGERSFLVLVNGTESATSPHAARIESILSAGAGYSSADTLTVQQFPFAPGVSAAPQVTELTEMSVLGLLTLLLCFLGFAPRRSAPKHVPQIVESETAPLRPQAAPVRVGISPKANRAAEAAAQDPAKAAEIIRKWMAGESAA